MSLHRQTLQIALAGAQTPLPEPLAALAAEWGEAAGPAEALLQAASVLVQAERCARSLPRHTAALTASAPPESLAPCAGDLAALLAHGLGEANPWIMRDKAELLIARGEYLPHELLPKWLEFASKHPAERAAWMACTGRRGPWLAALNPDWSPLLDHPPDDADWENGTLAKRAAWLSARRGTSPGLARAALESAWPQESPEAREKFLGCLSRGLSAADEGLLETARTDKRKEVRRLALDLLEQLPESAFSKRMLARLEEWLAFTPGRLLRAARLEVRLPAAHEKSWLLDGIPEKTTRQNEGIGDKANWLVEALSHVPLEQLLNRLGLDVETWFRLVRGHEFAAALWTGSVLGFERHPWTAALAALAAVPAAPLRARMLQASLAAARARGPVKDWLAPWLADAETDWTMVLPLLPRLDESLTRSIFKRLRIFLEARRGQYVWAALLPQFSERAHASVLAEWLVFLDPLGNEPHIHKSVDAAASIASLRQRLQFFHPVSRPS